MQHLKAFFIYTFFILLPLGLCAQVELGAGGSFGYPHLFNSLHRYGYKQNSVVGISATLAYKFGTSFFYPSFSADLQTLELPIGNVDGITWSDEMTKKDLMLHLCHRREGINSEWNFYFGIGVSFISADNTTLSSANGNYGGVVYDSSNYTSGSAAADIGAAYKFRLSTHHPHWWLGMNFNLQDVYVRGSHGDFYVSSANNVSKSNFDGNLLTATFFLSVYYRFGKIVY